MSITLNEALEIAGTSASSVQLSPEMAEELVRTGYRIALEDAVSVSNEIKVSPEGAKEKTFQGGMEVGKAVARRILQDKLSSLQKRVP